MLKISSFTMCFSLLLEVCAKAYISALRDFEIHRNRDKEKLIKLSVCSQALLVTINRKISCSPATFPRISKGYHYHPGRRKGYGKGDQLHFLFAVERWDAKRREMKGNIALDFTVRANC